MTAPSVAAIGRPKNASRSATSPATTAGAGVALKPWAERLGVALPVAAA